MDNRFITPEFTEEDDVGELSLRPAKLSEYIGQKKVKENLKIFIKAAQKRGEALDHTLLYGPPGLGKTTLANIIAREMGGDLKITSGPAIERAGDLAAILTSLKENDVLFIDEIHRLSRTVEEILYPAMEDYALDIVIGKGAQAKSIRIDLPKFTLIGATTRLGLLTSPLRDRFGILCAMEFYEEAELTEIITRSADILDVCISKDGACLLAGRSRGTPRIANRLLKRVRDYADVYDVEIADADLVKKATKMLGIDDEGFDSVDNKILEALVLNFKGGPVGVETLAYYIGEETSTVEDVYEPYLLQKGFLIRTPRGRIAGDKAYKHLMVSIEDQKENKADGKQCSFFE